MNLRNPRNSGRKKGYKNGITNEELELANELRFYIKNNNINLNLLRHKIDMRNSCIYYFMQEKTNLVSWLARIEEILTLCAGFKRNAIIKQANEN
jgi:hypothetical protein